MEIHFSFNGPSWSISNEIFFYMLFPFLLMIINRFRKRIFYVLIILTIYILSMSLIVPKDLISALLYVSPFSRIVDFTLGIALYFIFIKKQGKSLNYNKYSLFEFLSLILFFLFFYFHKDIAQVFRYSIYYWLPMLVIIFIFSFDRGCFSMILSSKILVYLGEISFGFYMFHQLVIRYYNRFIVDGLFLKFDLYFNDLINIMFIFIISLLVSMASYEIFENRFKRLTKKFFVTYFN